MKKIPRWLQCSSYSLSSRPALKIDELEEDGTALDTVRRRPSQRSRAIKQAVKQVMAAEGWVEYFNNKSQNQE